MTTDDLTDLFADLSTAPLTLAQQTLVDSVNVLQPKAAGIFEPYRNDPVGYVRDVLGVKPWSMQEDVLRLIASPHNDEWHGKLALGAGTNAGKTFIGGSIINWAYDCLGPIQIPTTAPSQQSVVDLLWKEVRLQRGRAHPRWGIGPQDFIGPQAPHMRRGPDWWAKGFVASKGENFKGRHGERMIFVFDESVGMAEMYFDVTKTMFNPGGQMLWLCLYNPTDTTSAMYQEIIHPESTWYVMELSSLEHPNVIAELKGDPPPIPSAVSLAQVEAAIRDDCEPVELAERKETDFEFPPDSGEWWRAGASFSWAYLGRWPTGDDDCLWSDALWKSITKPLQWKDVVIPAEEIPRVGCDTASKGNDKCDTHVSWGDYSVAHESRGKVSAAATCGRLIDTARHWAETANEARKRAGIDSRITEFLIPIMIDDDGLGGAIASFLREKGYRVFPIGAATKARRINRYPNKRSELWFEQADRARSGHVHLGLLPKKIIDELKRQAMAPKWQLNSAGQRVIEEKEQMRARLGRSPDAMDAKNLSYYVIDFRAPEVIHLPPALSLTERIQDQEREYRRSSIIGRRGSKRGGLFRR
jgi:hypothetical protein